MRWAWSDFALLGVSQAAAIAVAYAARHPDRVSAWSCTAGMRAAAFRGEDSEEDAIVAAIRAGLDGAESSVPQDVQHAVSPERHA